MINTNNLYVIELKNNVQKVKSFINALILLSGLLSFVYLVYYGGVLSDDILLSYTRQYFEPLAAFLNPGVSGIEMYLSTSLYLFLAIFPLALSQYFIDKFEEALVKANRLKEQAKQIKEAKKAYENSLKQYDIIKCYSICLSVDYSSKSNISLQAKEELNKKVYDKIKTLLLNSSKDITIKGKDVLIISSENFDNYDCVYSNLLQILAKVKTVVESKHNLKFIPSLTTDAYYNMIEAESIKRKHFEIQSFNFKNRALTSALFTKKYKHLNHNKYAGIPIGEYAYFDNNKMGTYELNVVFKNLGQTLETIK